MPISATCTCGQFLQTDAANAGHALQCPRCGRDWNVSDAGDPSQIFFIAEGSGAPDLLDRQTLRNAERNRGRFRDHGKAIAQDVFGIICCLFLLWLLMPATSHCGPGMNRTACTNNLKQISLAMDAYQSDHGCLPPAAITDKNGKPLLSWRVAMLPYLENGPLYAKFHLDEPWDSPHNRTLLDQMPGLYNCPRRQALKPGMTGYQVVVGHETAFTPDLEPLPISGVTDEFKDTLLVAESVHPVFWTQPDDIPFAVALHTSELGDPQGAHDHGFGAAFADGSVRFLRSTISPRILHAFLTRNGNEAVAADSY